MEFYSHNSHNPGTITIYHRARRTQMENSSETEDLEPLFDYRCVQPYVICFNDDDKSPASSPKRRKIFKTLVEKKVEGEKIETAVVNCDDEEEDWLPPPPKVVGVENQLGEDSTLRELRLKKQELVSVLNSAEDVLREMDESVKRKLGTSLQASLETSLAAVAEKPSKPPCEREKIVISVQDKDGLEQFRIYMDDKLDRLFKMYADKVRLDMQNLVFCFDGDKIGPAATPAGLGMEEDDIIEVHERKS